MDAVTVLYTNHAARDLKNIDRQYAKRIVAKVYENAQLPNPLERAKPLTGNLAGLYRYRIESYRVVFEVSKNGTITVLLVLTVQHRKDIYR